MKTFSEYLTYREANSSKNSYETHLVASNEIEYFPIGNEYSLDIGCPNCKKREDGVVVTINGLNGDDAECQHCGCVIQSINNSPVKDWKNGMKIKIIP